VIVIVEPAVGGWSSAGVYDALAERFLPGLFIPGPDAERTRRSGPAEESEDLDSTGREFADE
jgi:hypothetical protein